MESLKCVFVDWPTVGNLARKAAEKVKTAGFRPDTVVAIARGGVVPGRLFCDHLHIKNFAIVKVDHWGVTATKDGKAKLAYGTSLNLEGRRILLVDDITDTGESIQVAGDYIEGRRPGALKTATLYHLEGSSYVPDFFGRKRAWAWMIFPWNRQEDLVNLVDKLLGKEKKYPDAERLKREMKRCYQLDIDIAELEEIFNSLLYLGRRSWEA